VCSEADRKLYNRPVSFYWKYPPTDPNGHCLDEGKATLAAGILNLTADLFTWLIPIPMVMRLKMPLRQRVGVSAVFGLGAIVMVAGVVRTYFIWKGMSYYTLAGKALLTKLYSVNAKLGHDLVCIPTVDCSCGGDRHRSSKELTTPSCKFTS
jgi:hypothetical protein